MTQNDTSYDDQEKAFRNLRTVMLKRQNKHIDVSNYSTSSDGKVIFDEYNRIAATASLDPNDTPIVFTNESEKIMFDEVSEIVTIITQVKQAVYNGYKSDIRNATLDWKMFGSQAQLSDHIASNFPHLKDFNTYRKSARGKEIMIGFHKNKKLVEAKRKTEETAAIRKRMQNRSKYTS